ncbi:M20/M25/M40 family metallo-hydrolase [Labrys wisconsinensis]|uniref:Acetylornithine deacetylase/succinyl-diaminopimelate desuccinylase-like protein n=1 Tax=Labrys wisconsinensis TaxID=425677 RepID=A0ABU0J614_9HYPH|nr:M20/M25/M40 family metallo-hydrolase [Labrys wisconsinensis]MDQ0469698.1 acetylornithine deacetylase/succinyl-diaminopimelate desuccinylase-like protein [Labrys wisconsinensis]
MPDIQNALAAADRALDQGLDRLFEFLRIPSISADPAYEADCRRAADWAAAALRDIGFDASPRKTIGHPMVVGHRRSGRAGAPHVLFYGHYDVQPPDPLELWTSPPFEPQRVAGPNGDVIVARGASDDKGQVMTFIEACRALIETQGGLPVDVTVLLEGEEESSSKSLVPFLTENREELKADFGLICDTDMFDAQTPAVTTMLRGIVYEEVSIRAAAMDLHSGMYGGAAQNPIRVLARILAGLHDEQGRITLAGFYDGVEELPPAVKREWEALGFDGAAFLGAVGLKVPAGEAGRSVMEQITVRPTCDVNGIVGGYTGDGAKTVIPAVASAKVSFRLVGSQDPVAVQAAFRRFVTERLPADCEATFLSHGNSPAIVVPSDSEPLRKARAALAEEWGRTAPVIGAGGSIPVVGELQRILGIDSLLIGFALEDDRIHSPNEKYDVRSFHKGVRSWIRILDALGR